MKYFYEKDPFTNEDNKHCLGLQILDIELEVVEPCEPSDLIHENLEISPAIQRKNECKLKIFVMAIIFIAFII